MDSAWRWKSETLCSEQARVEGVLVDSDDFQLACVRVKRVDEDIACFGNQNAGDFAPRDRAYGWYPSCICSLGSSRLLSFWHFSCADQTNVLKLHLTEHMQTLWQVMRFAVRMLIKSPGFSATAVLRPFPYVKQTTENCCAPSSDLSHPVPGVEKNRNARTRLLCGLQDELLHTPVQQFGSVENVLGRAREFVNPAKLAGTMASGA